MPPTNYPNLNHGQDTRANRTRHTTSSSTQSTTNYRVGAWLFSYQELCPAILACNKSAKFSNSSNFSDFSPKVRFLLLPSRFSGSVL